MLLPNFSDSRGMRNAPTRRSSRNRAYGTRFQVVTWPNLQRGQGASGMSGRFRVTVWPASSRYEPIPGLSPMLYMCVPPWWIFRLGEL